MSCRLRRIQNWEVIAKEAEFRPIAMADLCFVSLRTMERFFVLHFQKTPSRWVRELRCELARRLIAQGYSNKAVVQELAFGNDSHLCHDFRAIYGVSPQGFAPLYGSPASALAIPSAGGLGTPGRG